MGLPPGSSIMSLRGVFARTRWARTKQRTAPNLTLLGHRTPNKSAGRRPPNPDLRSGRASLLLKAPRCVPRGPRLSVVCSTAIPLVSHSSPYLTRRTCTCLPAPTSPCQTFYKFNPWMSLQGELTSSFMESIISFLSFRVMLLLSCLFLSFFAQILHGI